MEHLWLLAGLLIILVTVADLAFTTLSSSGAGYFTNLITNTIWRVGLGMAGNDGSKKFLEKAGIVTIGCVIAFWFLSIWLGSALIFCFSESSVVYGQTGRLTTAAEKFYYSGFTLSTLGVGDYVANGDGWRIFTVVLSLTGFMLITTAITYMLPVLSADVEKKRISTFVNSMGSSPQEILINHWQNGEFKGLESHALQLADHLIMHSQQLLAYPVLYSFHNSDLEKSVAVSIGKLDEALTILLVHIPEAHRPKGRAIITLRRAITHYLVTQKNYFLNMQEEELNEIQMPDLQELEAQGIPLLEIGEEVKQQQRKLLKRKSYMKLILRNEGRKLEDIYKAGMPAHAELEL
ncbi:potassium channel family protein [Pontibacter roseus]|uniref:potassium channel family protein n=1 Tax=Pontibacter roseus TaxID=336989 RepID=UPI00036BE2E3|nr:potassium channel family protein [Pontibacter roseus]